MARLQDVTLAERLIALADEMMAVRKECSEADIWVPRSFPRFWSEKLRDIAEVEAAAMTPPERLQDVTLAERLLALHARLDAKLGAGFIDDIPGDELSAIREAAAALSVRGDEWIAVADRLPEIRDGGVLVYFSKFDAVETVNIEDYFRPITAGLDDAGNQLYALWAASAGVTHWMPLPQPPKEQP